MSSSDIAASVRGLSKSYTIAHNADHHTTLGEALLHRVKQPFQKPEQETFWALKDVSFDIKKGDVVGIIGRNGAGKSTLLKVLSQITEPTTGEINLYGRVGSLLEVGTGFHPELTGRENIYLNGAILGMRRNEIERQFDAIIDFAEVEQFLDTPVKRYSSGMYVRLAFAVAAHLNPDILVVDEVLAVGDAQFQKKCLGKMNSIASQGRTIFFVTHNMAIVRQFCPTTIWLQKGQILEFGNTESIINQYLHYGSNIIGPAIDLDKQERNPDQGRLLRITALHWGNGATLTHTGSCKVKVDFKALSDLDEVSVGIGFSTLEGTRLLTYETDDPGKRVSVKRGHIYSSAVEIDYLPLTPGHYIIEVGARSGTTKGVDYLSNCMQIEIVPGERTQGHHANGKAGVRLPSQWSWSNENSHDSI